MAATPPTVSPSTEFDITGFLQSATLDTPGDAHSGGTMLVNGHTIIVPRETIVILPAAASTWQELFANSPAPYTGVATGMALTDAPAPTTTYEVHVVGNRVVSGGRDEYRAGLINISQQDLNSGQGYISFIDYSTGTIEVGGINPGTPDPTATRIRINDPANASALDQNGAPGSGRYGRAFSPDVRFQVDQDNPTIMAETGFPMCIPRVTSDPTVNGNPDDPQCPQRNRPIVNGADTSGISPQPNTLVQGEFYTLFRMDSPANVDAGAGCLRVPCADPRKQAPLEVGDYITFAGNLVTGGNSYIAAHTITASVGIYTQLGVDPAYVSVDVSLIGTGGLTVFGAGEAAVRTRFEGMSTDESRGIHLYGIDINPLTGVATDRDWGTIGPDPGPPGGAVRGRWRFRPPCLVFGTVPTKPDKQCVMNQIGQFIPPTREVRAVIEGLQQFVPGTILPNPNSQVPGTASAKTAANGIFYGQYHAPIEEYIFPENVPGTAVPENNFNTINFLAYGGYQSNSGVQAGVLSPWPSNVTPPPVVCAAPTLNGAPYTVVSGGSVTLSGSITAGATSPVTVAWTAGTGLFGTPTGNNLAAALTGANTTTPTFNASGLAAGAYNVNLTVSNICGVQTVSSTVTVQGAPPPTINPIQSQNVTAGNLVTITATSNSLPAPTWAWTQTGGPVNVPKVQAPSAATPSATSSIQFTPNTVGTYTFSVKATNANGTSSATTVTVTVTTAVLTNITFGGTLEYRIAKQRLVMTATSTDPTVSTMVLLPYLTESGTVFDPTTLGANLTVSLVTPGSFTITAVGAPKPACNLGGTYGTPCTQTPITVKSKNAAGTIIGTSAPTAMQKIRQ
jgi:hypothetical protein